MKKFHSLLLASCALLALASARATTVIPPTFDELVNQAELIFQGTVTDVRSEWIGEGANRHIVSYVTFRIDDQIKGDAGANYTLRMLGGTVGDQTMEVSDSPKFVAGDHDILFVENNGRQFIPLVGIMHGRFHIRHNDQTGADVVLNDRSEPVTDLAKLGKESAGAPSINGPALQPADFKAAIRAKLAAGK
jgi:hypothetical protein